MKKTFLSLLVFCIFSMSACGFNCVYGKRPIDYPNTKWVAKEVDIIFEVNDSKSSIAEGTIFFDNELEVIFNFGVGDVVYIFEKKDYLYITEDDTLFGGYGKFSPDMFTLKITTNDKGILPNDIEEITFIREDIK